MGVLNKPYELSVWGDYIDANGAPQEQKLCVIGAHYITSQSRALNPKLTQNINGTNNFSFSIYYRYKDNTTGQLVENPFAKYLTNERKLKLQYDDQWYDFLIKNVKIDSTKYSYEVSCIDQYINELSKNGFNIVFDPEMQNNVGSIQTLAQRTLEHTDWIVPDAEAGERPMIESEFIPDKSRESLVVMYLPSSSSVSCTQIIETGREGLEPSYDDEAILPAGTKVAAFYSCCKDKNAKFFSFIDISDESALMVDDERVITNKDLQYFCIINSWDDSQGAAYGISVPSGWSLASTESGGPISSKYRGARYVFSPDTKYIPVLHQYATEYGGSPICYGYTTTDYIAPNFIESWVTNGSDFKSTAGWVAAATTADARGALRNESIRHNDNNNHTFLWDVRNKEFDPTVQNPKTYDPILWYQPADSSLSLLVNTGFYDNRTAIGNLVNGDQYRIRINSSGGTFKICLGRYPHIDNNPLIYDVDHGVTFFECEQEWHEGTDYAIVTIENSTFTPNQYKVQADGKVVLIISGVTANATIISADSQNDTESGFRINSFDIYKAIPYPNAPSGHDSYVTPEDQPSQARIETIYHLYNKSQIDGATPDQDKDDFSPVYEGTTNPESLGWAQSYSCEKRRSITIKESNFFNIIQTACETFECWATFDIEHDNNGAITGKTLRFRNYIGDDNFAGFRYGVNLKQISRTDDSKQIVTKLIVKQNSNEFGPHGFCTIARAGSNETKETDIYNVDYYINHGLLNGVDWINAIYNTTNASSSNSNGYYVRLYAINKQLFELNEVILYQASEIAHAQADVQMYSNGLSSAEDTYEHACEVFRQVFGIEYWRVAYGFPIEGEGGRYDWDFVKKNIKYLTNCTEAYQAILSYKTKYDWATDYLDDLQATYTELERQRQALITEKDALNKAFFSKFYRYIQEGTWNSEEYYDDEKYYLDAVSTLYNSSTPQVSYSISALELSQLEGLELFTFRLGDRTFIEDPEFFGYGSDGAPLRERVTLTEITYNLDQPEKNTIKIQNYKSNFQDLFKAITATVQSVQYSAGAYDKAAALADANDQIKSSYLQGALNDAGTILQNLADQSVRLDSSGLTITDGLETNKALRAVSGGILLTEDGGRTWQAAITAKGISASMMTTGTLNTSNVNIMFGDEPTFRWDSYGLTAYDFASDTSSQIPIPNLYRGVRFDRLGIYGFDIGGGNGADWHPTAVADWTISSAGYGLAPDGQEVYVRNHSRFELTDDGVYLSLADMKQRHYYTGSGYSTLSSPSVHEGRAHLGRVDDLLFNSWNSVGIPYYDPALASTAEDFVKVFSVGQGNDERLVIYDDGTLVAENVRLTGAVSWAASASPDKTIYATTALPTPTSVYADIPASSSVDWHKTYNSAFDMYYAKTGDGGLSWDGPFLLQGRDGPAGPTGLSITSVKNWYLATSASSGVTPTSSGWTETIQSISISEPYLWNYEQVYGDTILISYTDPIIIGHYGEDGEAGRSLTSIIEFYQISNNSTSAPTSWTSSFVSTTTAKPYLWNYEEMHFSAEPSVVSTTARIIGTHGADGSDGSNGTDGTGSVVEIQNIYCYNDNTTTPSLPSVWITNSSIPTSGGVWTTSDIPAGSSPSYQLYVFKTGQIKITEYTGDTPGASTVTTDPATIYKAYLSANVSQTAYAEFLRLTNNGTAQGLKYGTDGNVYINATYINAGTLTVSDTNHNTIFSASVDSHSVQIGGFTVTDHSLYGEYTINNTTKYVGLNAIGSSTGYLIYAGASDPSGSDRVFSVNNAGNLYSVDGTIGGWTINSYSLTSVRDQGTSDANFIGLYSSFPDNRGTQVGNSGYKTDWRILSGTGAPTSSSNGAAFGVDRQGNVYASSLQAYGGHIAGWTIESNQLYGATSSSGTFYRRGFANGSSLTSIALYIGATSSNLTTAPFYVRNDGYVKCTNIYVEGQIGASGLQLASDNSAGKAIFLGRANSSNVCLLCENNDEWTNGGSIETDSSNCYIRLGVRNSTGSLDVDGTHIMHLKATTGRLLGTWYTNSGNTVTSDKRLKHDINKLDDKYTLLFDNLAPIKFKYNDGTSDRFHTGFIAQDVQDALSKAQLTTQEFGGLVYDGTYYGLRYDEFIALNTWQIQKLKSRITELESRISSLEEHLNET